MNGRLNQFRFDYMGLCVYPCSVFIFHKGLPWAIYIATVVFMSVHKGSPFKLES